MGWKIEKNIYRHLEEEYQKLREEIKNHESSGKYANVGFSYDTVESENKENEQEDDTELYQPSENMCQIPKGIRLPKFQREHDIIVKTAKFLASQSIQMEILLKTKQSGNDKFNFLDFGNELNDYYKFLKQAIKDKKFIPAETKDEVASESDSDSDTDSEGGYLHPSLLAGKVQQIEKEREASPVVAVDESHPLFKIIEGRKEAERLQKQKQLEAVQAKKEQNSTQITVPPPDISQTVKWTAHHLAKLDKSTRTVEEQRLLELNSSLSFLQPNNIYHNYFKTIMERAILTNNGNESYSPPHAPSASTIPFQFDAQPISFKISSKQSSHQQPDTNGAMQRKEEAIRKAQEVAIAIEQRKEVEQKLARRMRDKLHSENSRTRQSEDERRDRHRGNFVAGSFELIF